MPPRLSRCARRYWLPAVFALLYACSGAAERSDDPPAIPASELPEHCKNQRQNTSETDVDCGGPDCNRCAVGRACLVSRDCVSELCVGGSCRDRSCANERMDAMETDVDCGSWRCPACVPGKGCAESDDCTSGICAHGVCAEATCDDGVRNGAELDVDCGAPGCSGCHTGNRCTQGEQCASGVCEDGVCGVSCSALTAECDDDLSLECETEIMSDPDHCGACDSPCVLAHAVPSCVEGVCRIERCESPYRDCNGDPSDGCEANLDSDPKHCASCDLVCSAINGDPLCFAGTCALTCAQGYDDCDHDAANGCETQLDDDVEHCGGCNRRCTAPDGATPRCRDGQCEGEG